MLFYIYRIKLLAFTLFSIIGLYYYWDPAYIILALVAYFLFGPIGIELGLHRYYSHQSFTCNKIFECFIWLCAFFSGSSDPLSYAQRHVRHHRYSDTKFDNLQPINHPILTWFGFGILKASYVDISKMPVPSKLKNNRFHCFVNKYYLILYYGMLAICFMIDPKVSFYILILGATIAAHMQSALGIFCHRNGYRNFNTADNSRNNLILNVLSFGQALHNNHHAYPYAYTTKVKPQEHDIIGWIIKHIFSTSVLKIKQ